MRGLKYFFFGLLLLALLLSAGITYAQSNTTRYFPQTGHWLQGEFLQFYNSIPGAESVFGAPISLEFVDQVTHLKVQYLQRARFELHPDAPPGKRVMLTNLGEFLYKPGRNQPLDLPSNVSACRFFPGKGLRVCYAFLDFYEEHGGLEVFGNPVSDFELQDGRIVQYFERAIFTWNPEMPRGFKVQLREVGRMYFSEIAEDYEVLIPLESSNIAQSILNLKVRAFTDKALVTSGEPVTLFVIVQDQTLEPVDGAQVIITLRFPSGDEETYLIGDTDVHGVNRFAFAVKSAQVGIVEVHVSASQNGFEENTRTSFRIWW